MDNQTFQVLDECYFLTSRDELLKSTEISPDILDQVLTKIWNEGFLRTYKSPDGEEYSSGERVDWDSAWFVISKKGLQEHTSG